MQLRRSLTAGITLTSLLLMVAAPASAATETTTTKGSAVTTSVPLLVEAAGVPVELGSTELIATTDDAVDADAPWSGVALTLADVDGTAFGELAVTSDGTTTSPGTTIGENTAVGAVTATAADLFAVADDSAGTATAALTSLTTDATVLDALGLSVTITDVVASVDDGAAAATHSLAVAGIDVDLANILGEVLSTLPLQDLLALADLLGVEIPVDLSSADAVVTATEELLVAVADAAAAATDVEDAAAALLAADGGTLADLEALDATIQAIAGGTLDATAVTSLVGVLTDPLLADCAITPTLVTLADDLADAAACVTLEIQGHLASLTGVFTALEDAVTAYLSAVTAATDAAAILQSDSSSLGDIVGQIQTLLDDLLAADLLAVGPIDVSQQVRAVGGQPDASSASHTCKLTTLSALGATPVEIADCDGGDDTLGAAIDTVTATLAGLLDVIGGVDAGDGVELELFGTVQDTVTEGADGTVRATSVMEVLSLTVPDVTISPCDVADGLVCALGLDLDGTLSDALDGVDGVLTAAQGTVTTALGTVTDLLDALGETLEVTGVDGAQATIDAAVAALEAAVATLTDGLGDLGTAGDITIPGARIVVDPELVAEHQVVTAAAGPGDPAPAPNPAPNPRGAPTLPNTGGGAALLAVLTLGAGAWLFRRREVQ